MGYRRILRRITYLHFIPFLWAFILLPLLLMYLYCQKSYDGVYDAVKIFQLLTPPIGLLLPYIESYDIICPRGNELMFLSRRNKMNIYGTSLILYGVIMIPSFWIADELFDFNNIWYEYGRMISITCFLIGLYYALLFITYNYMITCIACVLSVFLSMYNYNRVDALSFISLKLMTREIFSEKYIVWFGTGLALFGIGYFVNRNYRRFN